MSPARTPDVREAHRRARSRTAAPVSVAADTVDAIEAAEPALRAFARIDRDAALTRAAAAPDGPLAGVPIAVKDLIDTADEETEYGSPIYRGHRPAQDAGVVTRLREAGALIVGKTVTTEFALFAPPPTRNPHDPARTPGGSSSGSAAAVAAGLVPVAVGTQTAGSIIRPASYCGVVGFKPTSGALPRDGVKRLSETFDTVGLIGRSVEDVRLVFDAVRPTRGRIRKLGLRRIAVARTTAWERVRPDGRRAFEEAVALFRSRGFDVFDLDLDDLVADTTAAQIALMEWEVSHALRDERERHPDLLSSPLRAYLDQAAARSRSDADRARETIRACRERFPSALGLADAVLTPAVEGEAPAADSTGDPWFSRAWTALGVPTIALPLGHGDTGLPIGIQLVARVGEDDVLLDIAAAALSDA